jgi:archaemetzincin
MIEVVAVGEGVEPARLDALAAELARIFWVSCHVRDGVLDLRFAHDAARGQYHSTAILERMVSANGARGRLLGVTAVDLFVPIFTFVFGEAQVRRRLRPRFVLPPERGTLGLPPDEGKLGERLAKEAVHELGTPSACGTVTTGSA